MRLLTAKEVSKILRVPTARVYELVREDALPAVRLGQRQVRFDEGLLREWIARGGAERTGNSNHGQESN